MSFFCIIIIKNLIWKWYEKCMKCKSKCFQWNVKNADIMKQKMYLPDRFSMKRLWLWVESITVKGFIFVLLNGRMDINIASNHHDNMTNKRMHVMYLYHVNYFIEKVTDFIEINQNWFKISCSPRYIQYIVPIHFFFGCHHVALSWTDSHLHFVSHASSTC